MSTPESGKTTGYERYLNLDEREALSRESLMRRGHAVLATAQLLESLGIDGEAFGDAIATMRIRLEAMPTDGVQSVGHYATLLATLLQPEDEPTLATPITPKYRQVEMRGIQGTPATVLDLFTGMLSPSDLTTYSDLKAHQMQWLFEQLQTLIQQQLNDEADTKRAEQLLAVLEPLMYGSNKKMVAQSVGISEEQVSHTMVDLRDLLSTDGNVAHIREDLQSASRLTLNPVVTPPAAPEVPQPTVNTAAERRVGRTDKPVPAYSNLQASFRNILSDTEIRTLIDFTPPQITIFLEELEKIIRQKSNKPSFAGRHTSRLHRVINGASYAEIAQEFDSTESSVYQSAGRLNHLLAGAQAEVQRIFALALTYTEAPSDERREEQVVKPVVATEEDTPSDVEVVTIDPVVTIVEQFQTLFSDDPHHKEVLEGLLDVNRTHASNREIEQEIARLINHRIDAQKIDFEALFEGRGELVVVRSFIGRFVQAGRTQTIVQRPPRSLHDIAQTIRPEQAKAQLLSGLNKLFAAFEPAPAPEDTRPSTPNPEDIQPLDEFLENACWTIGATLGFSNQQTLALLYRLRDEETEVKGDLMTANMSILRAAKALNGKLSENDSRLLVAYLAPRVGQPPLSLEEITRDFSDLFGEDKEQLKRKIGELYVEVGSQA